MIKNVPDNHENKKPHVIVNLSECGTHETTRPYSFVFPFTAVTKYRHLWEAAERVLPRAFCDCSHLLQGQMRYIGT